MKISMGLVLALSLMSTVTNAQFNNEVPERQSRADRPMKLCGQQLGQVLSLVCGSRGKRHAVAEPSYRMSPFMMSIYRPSIDDEDKWAADWADLKLESSPGMDFYNRINSLRNLRKRSIVRVSDVCCKNSCTMHQLREFCD